MIPKQYKYLQILPLLEVVVTGLRDEEPTEMKEGRGGNWGKFVTFS